MCIALLIFFGGGIEGARRAVSGGGEWARGRVGVWVCGAYVGVWVCVGRVGV